MSTRTGKGKKRKRIGKLSDKAQSDRFMKEAERLLGQDMDPADFIRAVEEMLKPKKQPKGGSN